MTPDVLSPHFPRGTVTGQFSQNGRRLTLTAPFQFRDGGTVIDVPAGFVTDFNSVPRGGWNVFAPWEYPEAGVTHDWLYQHPGGRPRGDCDAVHRRVMEIEGASRAKRWGAWAFIRAFGWKPWNRYRKAESEGPVYAA